MTETAALPSSGASSEELERMTLFEHLEELRTRILRSAIALALGFGICWTVREQILDLLMKPILPHLEGGKLAIFDVTSALFLYMKVAGLAGVFLVSPYLVAQLWGFVAPGLYRREKMYAVPFIVLGTAFFLAGGYFAYAVAFEHAVEFLLGMGDKFDQVLAADRYLRFMMTIILGMGLMFELPIVVFMVAQVGLVTPRFLMRHFRWAVLIIFIVAAILTPTPDPFNLCLFALPTIGLYLLGVAAAAIAQRGRKKEG